MLRKRITRAECRIEFDWVLGGSVRAGTVYGGARACRSSFVIESPDSDEDIVRLITLAKQGCYAEQMVQSSVPLTSSYVINNREVEVTLAHEQGPS